MHKLDILIPQYKETEEVIKPLLDSIAIQQNIDFEDIEAIIVNDGTDIYLSDDFLNNYPFKIHYYKEEHRGVSGTRNSCLDHSTAKYIMYCDADDMFFNACGLWMMFEEIDKNQADVYTSKFVEEMRLSGKPFYINRENDSTFVHGKILRRQFLINNNIRWNSELTIHEDSYFNCLAQVIAQKGAGGFKYCETAFYLWKWRDDSICRRDPLYLNKTFINMYDSNQALIKECLDRRLVDEAISFILSMVYESYCAFNMPAWLTGEGNQYLLQTEKRFKKYWMEFKALFSAANNDKKVQAMSKIKNKYFKQGLVTEHITFDDWIKHIEELED